MEGAEAHAAAAGVVVMRIWFDTEFIEDGRTIDLLSIGMVREDGVTYYAEARETDHGRANPWVKENVLPYLTGPIKSKATIREDIIEFAGRNPEFWAYFADYDWVVLCQLYGTMMDLPATWPMFCRDVQQEIVKEPFFTLPLHEGTLHNALDDARWCKQVWEALYR